MRDFLKFILNSHFFLLFLLLESISIFLIVRNTEKADLFISSANSVSGFFHKNIAGISDYFSLKNDNELLKLENEKLKNYIHLKDKESYIYSEEIEETGSYYISAKVIKNSVYNPYNFITINKGESDGLKEDMAVVSDAGVVGIVANVSKNYASVISLLNLNLSINAKIKRTNFFGSLKWDREDYRYVYLYDIPDHSSLYVGDEVITGGFSSIFPEGIKIGTVQEFENEKQNSFYKIKVKLSQDFKKLKHVYAVDYSGRTERLILEDSTARRFNYNY
jgi:rod shape-determining protein MreC